jgi:hypothetical protein
VIYCCCCSPVSLCCSCIHCNRPCNPPPSDVSSWPSQTWDGTAGFCLVAARHYRASYGFNRSQTWDDVLLIDAFSMRA